MEKLRLNNHARGVYVISATPFADDGALDLDSTARLVDHYLQAGVTGITILGIMGEAPKLNPAESLDFVRTVVRRIDGRIPIVVGVSAPGTDNLAAFSRRVMDEGASGVMIAPIPGLRTDEQIRGYFAETLEALGPEVPVCLQDYPQTLGVWLSPSLIVGLINDFPQIVMFKHEDSPGLRKLSRVRSEPARRVSILVGNGGIHLPQEMRRGADGAMTGFAFPGMLVRAVDLFDAGLGEEAEDLYDLYLPLLRHELQPGIGLAIRKYLLWRQGAIASPRLRAPGPKLDDTDRAEIDALLIRLERKLGHGP